jgi:hypothetical protein
MSRSFKKNPVTSICKIREGEQKQWKGECNKKIRTMDGIHSGSEYKKVTGGLWNAPSDGKQRFTPKCKKDLSK